MVSTRSSGCVVAITKMTRSGGSSSVFSRALEASPVSMCASSRITTLLLEAAGAYLTISRSSRIWSMPRFDAASISITSSEVPAARARKNVRVRHAVIFDRVLQRFGYMLLADEIVERLRTPLAGYDLVAHKIRFSSQFLIISGEKRQAHLSEFLPLKL